MQRILPVLLGSLMALSLAALMLLAACNTTAGAGKDISRAGHAITNSATQHSY